MRNNNPRYYTATFDKKTHSLIGIEKYALHDPSIWVSHWSEDLRIDSFSLSQKEEESMQQFYDKYIGDVYLETYIVER